ncbi:MAG TPA: phenylacetate--CoA ligase [Paracoccus solventivorans]|uniref:Phenylacetate--CoA ligase n=1 Tax=Paracoccus solventivorans TaxID=53463 RepID=A0A832PMX8_9RHOB|nr:AMP-binding protein [Paracoccus solventivorans]HHW33996.1 phenylacetate--CoA ligase [Paracoccus solventivorans]
MLQKMSGQGDMLHPEFETLPAARIAAIQEDLWRDQWRYLETTSRFYARKFEGLWSSVRALGDLQNLPFTTKEEVRRSQEEDFPFGNYVACGHDRIVRVHRTSGTTGRPLQLANSRRDVELIARIGGRSQRSAGLRPGDRVVHCLNYCMWTGGVTDHMTLEETGACVLPFGVGNTQQLLKLIPEMGVTAISCTPSYPALLERLLHEQGIDPRSLGLRIGLFGGEAGLDNIEFRENLETVWGMSARNANYGMSEILSNFASQCEHSADLHFHGADGLFVEILDKNDQPQPIREGVSGELVCTHLAKECQPLVRFRTRDVITVTGTDTCACGRTTWRFRVSGRTDDMFNVRGINVFPTSVQKAVQAAAGEGLVSGQFRIRLDGNGPWDRIHLRAEAARAQDPSAWPGIAARLAALVQEYAGASAVVDMLPPDSLPRTDGKTSVIERI